MAVVPIIVEALKSIRNPRFFDTERGYQGELLAELRIRLPDTGLPGDAIVEQEYQKRIPEHGINVRPDIIIHVPTLEGCSRRQGNFVVFELNLRAGAAESEEDFANLDAVLAALDYPLGVFVNIASSHTHAASYRGRFGERLHFFALRQHGMEIEMRHAYYRGGRLVEE